MQKRTFLFQKLIQKKVSTITGSLVLIFSLVLSLKSIPSLNNENENIFNEIMTSVIQQVEIKSPEVTVNEFRIELLKKELKKRSLH
ncbi:hypothetical protein KAI58_05040 [Candidatus Gracilibacteria bacterium]|nr:hypothetical protein [Candidatus Gracilibacteria bacterium]